MSIWKRLIFRRKVPVKQTVGIALYPADLQNSLNETVQMSVRPWSLVTDYPLSDSRAEYSPFVDVSVFPKKFGRRNLIVVHPVSQKKIPISYQTLQEQEQLQRSLFYYWTILPRHLITKLGYFWIHKIPNNILEFPYQAFDGNPYLQVLKKKKNISFFNPKDPIYKGRSRFYIKREGETLVFELHDRIFCSSILANGKEKLVNLGTIITKYVSTNEGFEFKGAKVNTPFMQQLLMGYSAILETMDSSLSLSKEDITAIVHEVIRNTEDDVLKRFQLFISLGFPKGNNLNSTSQLYEKTDPTLKLYEQFKILLAQADSENSAPLSLISDLLKKFIPILLGLREKNLSDPNYRHVYAAAEKCFIEVLSKFKFLFNDIYALNLLTPEQRAILNIMHAMIDETALEKALADSNVLEILKTNKVEEQHLLCELFRRHSDSLNMARAFTQANLVKHLPFLVGHGFSHAQERLTRFQRASTVQEKKAIEMEYCGDAKVPPEMRIRNFNYYMKNESEFPAKEISAEQFINLLAADPTNTILLQQINRPSKITRLRSFVEQGLLRWGINLKTLLGLKPDPLIIYNKLQAFDNEPVVCSIHDLTRVSHAIQELAGPGLQEHINSLVSREREKRVVAIFPEVTNQKTLVSESWLQTQYAKILPLLKKIEYNNKMRKACEEDNKHLEAQAKKRNLSTYEKEGLHYKLIDNQNDIAKFIAENAMLFERLHHVLCMLFREHNDLIQAPNSKLSILFCDTDENLLYRLLSLNDFRCNYPIFNEPVLQQVLQLLSASQLMELADKILFTKDFDHINAQHISVGRLVLSESFLEEGSDESNISDETAAQIGQKRIFMMRQKFTELVFEKIYTDFNLKDRSINYVIEDLSSNLKTSYIMLSYFKLYYIIRKMDERAFGYMVKTADLEELLIDPTYISRMDPMLLIEAVLRIQKLQPEFYKRKMSEPSGMLISELYTAIFFVMKKSFETSSLDLKMLVNDPVFRTVSQQSESRQLELLENWLNLRGIHDSSQVKSDDNCLGLVVT